MKCKICNNNNTFEILDLAKSPPSNAYSLGQFSLEQHAPLRLQFCKDCKLPQLEQFHQSTDLFTPEYAYESSVSTQWLAHCKIHVEDIMQRYPSGSKVLEIASNDGYLLQFFSPAYTCLGIEPTNMAQKARSKGIDTIQTFLTSKSAKEISKKYGKFNVLIAKNVFAHVPDLIDFAHGASLLMDDNAELIIEVPSFYNLVSDMSFDTVYHEHYFYHTVESLISMGKKVGLKLLDISKIQTHGGSYRAIFSKDDHDSQVNKTQIDYIINEERALYAGNYSILKNIQEKAFKQKLIIIEKLVQMKNQRLKVAAFGAAAKGNTILNYCGVKNDLIDCVFDNSVHKQGLYLPGSGIPIMPLEKLKDIKPDVIVVLPWNIKQELKEVLRDKCSYQGEVYTLMPKFEKVE